MNVSSLLLALGWILWCFLHSVLISRGVGGRLVLRMGECGKYFRLGYNLIAFITLVPMMVATARLQGMEIYSWKGGWVALRVLLLASSLLLFYGGSRRYDLGYFLGVKQIRFGEQHVLLTEQQQFSRSGVFAVTRHPWYLGSLLFLWTVLPVYHLGSVVAAAVLSAYLVIGTRLEERKLLAEFGDAYRSYRQEVSMFFPWKWLRNVWRVKKCG